MLFAEYWFKNANYGILIGLVSCGEDWEWGDGLGVYSVVEISNHPKYPHTFVSNNGNLSLPISLHHRIKLSDPIQ
jgi:hypothetical protein